MNDIVERLRLYFRWSSYKHVMKNYTDYSYYIFNAGVCKVRTKSIIGLSLWPPYEVANDKKMIRLKQNVKKEGWKDPYPRDLHLYLTPKGKYTVCSGGNHRAILADKLKLKYIKADVTIVVPKKILTNRTTLEIKKLEEKKGSIEFEAKQLNDYLISKGIRRHFDYKEKDKELDEMYHEIDKIEESVDKLLKEEVVKNNLALEIIDQII